MFGLKSIIQAGAMALAVFGVNLTITLPAQAETCEELLGCVMNLGRTQLPMDVCSSCGTGEAFLNSLNTAISDPSVKSACGTATSLAYLQGVIRGGPTSAVQQLICAFNPSSGGIDNTACNRQCEANCAVTTNVGFPPGFSYDPNDPGSLDRLRDEIARLEEQAKASDSAYQGCRLKCGCGWDGPICEAGATKLAQMVCSTLNISGDLAPKKDVSQACDWDSDCKNSACGYKTGAKDAQKVCCPSGTARAYGGYDYCTKMSDGDVCWSDAQCASGICSGNSGGLGRGTCSRSTRSEGEACESNAECTNRACGRPTAADGATKVCCTSNAITTYGGYDYCMKMPRGATCWSDYMCASEYCGGNLSGLRKGTCG